MEPPDAAGHGTTPEPTDAVAGSTDHPVDHGFTHIALQVADLDRSLAFYQRYADMTPVHRRTSSDGVRVAWVTDHTRPFIIVLLETTVTHPLGGWGHLGIGVDSREQVERRLADAVADGLETFGPHDSGPPAGYYGIVVDPDGHNLEIAHGQEVAFTVETSGD
jgi:catechol 2,3-dioxygenase-like lactoylglutathione lyase family enzyme